MFMIATIPQNESYYHTEVVCTLFHHKALQEFSGGRNERVRQSNRHSFKYGFYVYMLYSIAINKRTNFVYLF